MAFFNWTYLGLIVAVEGAEVLQRSGLGTVPLVIAFVAVALTVITSNVLFDALGTMGVGLILMVIAVAIMVEVKGMIVGESVAPELREEIRAFVAAQPEVEQVLNLITLAWGDMAVVAVKAKMRPSDVLTGDGLIAAVNAVEERVQQRYPTARWVFFEPGVR